MAIRSRISSNAVIIEEDIRDNVISVKAIGKINKDDHRGTFDLNDDAFAGSHAENLGLNKENSAHHMKRMAMAYGVGLPSQMPVKELLALTRIPNNPGFQTEEKYRERVRSPLTAIRGFCMDCVEYSAKRVAQCDLVECPFWALRMGRNTHRSKGTK